MNDDMGFNSFKALQMSPQSKRNTKNLSLKLSRPDNEPQPQQQQQPQSTATDISSPMAQSPSGFSTFLFRHPSLKRPSEKPASTLARRATLSLSIPSETHSSKSSAKLSSNSIPSFSTSSPISPSPVLPATPECSTSFATKGSSHSSTSTITSMAQNSNALKAQTLIQHISSMDITDDGDTHKLNAYPNGPTCVMEPNLYLYSEPTLEEVSKFDLVVNVARELKAPMHASSLTDGNSVQYFEHGSTQYYYVPWTHTSKLCPDLPFLTKLVLDSLDQDKRVLIHCQCGVSRSASLIVACFMRLYTITLNDAYAMLKQKARDISPNMSLIFQLMEWGEQIGVTPKNEHGYSPMELAPDPLNVEGSKLLYES